MPVFTMTISIDVVASGVGQARRFFQEDLDDPMIYDIIGNEENWHCKLRNSEKKGDLDNIVMTPVK
jgi:hypothetical protein